MEKTEKAGALIKRQWFIQARSGKIEDYYDFDKDKDVPSKKPSSKYYCDQFRRLDPGLMAVCLRQS